MMWHGWWWMMPVVLLGVVGVLMALLVVLSRSEPHWPSGPDPTAEAERILDERYARGEIDDAEFSHRRAVLLGRAEPRPS